MKNINIRNYKVWIIIFGIFNTGLLLWSIELVPFFKQGSKNEIDIITIYPKNKFIKITPPKDKQFPNDKSPIWNVYEDDKKSAINKTGVDKKESDLKDIENKGENKIENSEKKLKINKDKNVAISPLSASKKTINNQSKKPIEKLKKEKIEVKKSVESDVINLNKISKLKNKIDTNDKPKIKSFYVQTASLSKKELVAIEWKRIQKKYKFDIKDLIFVTEKTKLKNNQVFYRLLVGKFKSNNDAKNFCSKINLNNSCIIRVID